LKKRRTAFSTLALDPENHRCNSISITNTRRLFSSVSNNRGGAVVLDGLSIANKIAEEVKREAASLEIKPRLEVLMGKMR